MRLRTLLLLFLAVGLAGGTAMLARAWLAAQRAAEIAEASPMALPAPAKSVLVARTEIRRGQIMKPEDLSWQVWPEGGLDKSYVVLGTRTPESFAGWVARNPISAGEPLSETKIIAPGNRGFLAAVLRPGMRAISVPVTITSGISGFIFPGDQVDLMITHQIPTGTAGGNSGGYEHKAAETVLHDVRVIAIDQRLESKSGEAVVAHTATLEVTPKQTEMIAVAGEIGKLACAALFPPRAMPLRAPIRPPPPAQTKLPIRPAAPAAQPIPLTAKLAHCCPSPYVARIIPTADWSRSCAAAVKGASLLHRNLRQEVPDA